MKHKITLLLVGVFILAGPMIKANESTNNITIRPKVGRDGCAQIKANGSKNCITTGPSDSLTITVEMNSGIYTGINADWWVAAKTGSSWYYLNSSMQWTPFDGCLPNIFPAYQGPLFNLSPTIVFYCPGLPVGYYTFLFGVDEYDGTVTEYSWMLYDIVHVTVQ